MKNLKYISNRLKRIKQLSTKVRRVAGDNFDYDKISRNQILRNNEQVKVLEDSKYIIVTGKTKIKK